jgi:signal transduction histidine kinase
VVLAGSCAGPRRTRLADMTESADIADIADIVDTQRAESAPVSFDFTDLRRTLREAAYNLTAFPLGLVSFVVVLVLVVVGIGTSVIVGGVLLVVAGVTVARQVARLERLRLRTLLGRDVATPAYVRAKPEAGVVRRTFTPLRDPQSWLDVLWSLVSLVTGTVAFAVTLAWCAATANGLTYWFWERYLPDEEKDTSLAELVGFGDSRVADVAFQTMIGLVALLTLPFVVRALSAVHGGLAETVLCGRAELQQEVARVEGGRDAARVAEAASLRRLERDIHDGPQQRLVRLSMDLGRARKQLEQDPAKVAETLDAALLQARETVDELRSLSRGIAPPLLVDRGLRAALGELMVRSDIPVESVVRVPESLPPHVETAVYFVVAEALTNVAKHSGAERVSVQVVAADGAVRVRVEDDGRGGAHLGKGQGLAGLAQRLAGVDGGLELTSPDGGPTVLAATIPL